MRDVERAVRASVSPGHSTAFSEIALPNRLGSPIAGLEEEQSDCPICGGQWSSCEHAIFQRLPHWVVILRQLQHLASQPSEAADERVSAGADDRVKESDIP